MKKEVDLDELARQHHAFVLSDGPGFRRAARVLQSIWRQSEGLPVGEHRGEPLGSRLPTELAEKTLANYLTPTIRELVQSEVRGASNQVFAAPRIYDDLLSSQPLCFNLFGELKHDMELATKLFDLLRPGAVKSVVDIRFEYSPGRGEERFTGDRSAFDVFVEYCKPDGGRGFLGIEVKYHEDMLEPPAAHRTRNDEVAAMMGCFRPEALPALRQAPIEQLWRDHLLAGITQRELGYDEGVFILLYPAANIHCRKALGAYRATLCDNSTFDVWTLEEVVSLLTMVTPAGWVRAFHNRYLDFDRLGAG